MTPRPGGATPGPDRPASAARRLLTLGGLASLARTAVAARPAAATPARPAAPAPVRGVYLSYYGAGDRAIRERVLGLLQETELNAVVVDVKGDRGLVTQASRVPLAVEAGARGPVGEEDLDAVLARLRRHRAQAIARVVVFKDDRLARHRPAWAILDPRTGRPWIDREGLAWIDPLREEAWDYAIAIAREAARAGFDEVQLDYCRFPAEVVRATAETRVRAVSGFLERARGELGPLGVRLALDVFGYVAFNHDDSEIGQRAEDLAPRLDVLCPMAYPSAYHRGIPGYPNPVAHPYEVVHETVRRLRARTGGAAVVVRPWIQDFRDYAFDRRPFGVAEVGAQVRAAEDAGAAGWMLWNPRNEYTAGALRGRRE